MKEILWRLKGAKVYSKGFIVKRKFNCVAFSESEFGDSANFYSTDDVDIINSMPKPDQTKPIGG